MNEPRRALLIVLSDITNDPRVRRQISWLTQNEVVVDTLGLGEHPDPSVENHFRIDPPRTWTKTTWGLGLIHTLLPFSTRFKLLLGNRIPASLKNGIVSGRYDLILFNDIHLLPWLGDKGVFRRVNRQTHIHLDLHEWFPRRLARGSTRGLFLVQGYHAWVRNFIASPLVKTRSVAGGSGAMYAKEFGFEEPTLVRNAPAFEDLTPSPVSGNPLRLIHHGLAGVNRGFGLMVEAMKNVGPGFHLTFMLAGNPRVIADLEQSIVDQRDRISIVPPVPMVDLAREINKYDAEVMFFPPVTDNLATALPNKMFEAVQGRLAIVTGPTPTMSAVVHELGNGVVSDGWTAENLGDAIRTLTVENVLEMKRRSHEGAYRMSAEHEGEKFFESLGWRV